MRIANRHLTFSVATLVSAIVLTVGAVGAREGHAGFKGFPDGHL